MSARTSLVPVILLIDVEPDGFFIDREARVPWTGFEHALEVMAELRSELEAKTRRSVHFTWLVRADPQVAETYGSPGWALETYHDALLGLIAAGDEVGLHQHPYRWDARRKRWIDDYGDQEWVEHCVRMGTRAFAERFGRMPASFSMGMDWTNQATIDLLTELGIHFEFSTVLGKERQPFPPQNSYGGVEPDCSSNPRRPYQPDPHDFLSARTDASDGIWLIPQSSRVARHRPSLKRAVWEGLHGRPVAPLWTRKFFLQDDPRELGSAINDTLQSLERPYLTFAVRTHEYCDEKVIRIIRRNIATAMEHEDSARFVFATPEEGLRVMEYLRP